MKSIPYLACNFIYLLLLASPLMAENTLQKIDALIESKQCRSALAEVQTADPESEQFEYFLRKLDISLNCNVRHIHGTELFGFTDLQPGETLEDLRGRPPVRQYIVHGWSIREKIKAFQDRLAENDRFGYLAGQYFSNNCFSGGQWSGMDGAEACTKAREIYSDLARRNQYSPQSCIPLLETLDQLEDNAALDDVFPKCLAASPEDPLIIVYKAHHLHKQGKHEESIKLAEKAALLAKDDRLSVRCYSLAGQTALENRDFAEAERLFSEGMKKGNYGRGLLGLYTRSLLQQKKKEQAATEMLALLRTHEELGPPNIDRVREAYRDTGNYTEFIARSESWIADESISYFNRIAVYRSLTIAFIDQKDYDRARATIQEARTFSQENPTAYDGQIQWEFNRLADTIPIEGPQNDPSD